MIAHSHSGRAMLESFEDLTISDVSLFGWDDLLTELERPKRYVPDELSQVPRERIQAQLRRVSSRMEPTSPKFTARTRKQGTPRVRASKRMGLAVAEKVSKRGRRGGSPRGARRPLGVGHPPAAPNRLPARKGSKGNGRRKRRRTARKTKSQENAVGRGPSHSKMTRKREYCVQRTNEASCN